jgi:hypothetical protein
MTTITDDFMREMMGKTKPYCVVILKTGPNSDVPDVQSIIWEHGRRNFQLREQGTLSIVLPIRDGTEVHGVGIFNAGLDEVTRLMDEDPGVAAGVFVYEVHQSRSFPGDCLPA